MTPHIWLLREFIPSFINLAPIFLELQSRWLSLNLSSSNLKKLNKNKKKKSSSSSVVDTLKGEPKLSAASPRT
uniref:Uncharacterized protein n=1 Tax=Amphimedon queenslandica TaxID=400682 RepID=A0A1X7V4J1_AMPQE